MYWLILLPLLLGLSIYLIIKTDPYCSDWLYLMSHIAAILTIVALIITIPTITLICPQRINTFEQQKAYIETHIPKNDIEDAAITSKKVELNEWLYKAQFNKKNLGGWSMYSGKVLELEPIE